MKLEIQKKVVEVQDFTCNQKIPHALEYCPDNNADLDFVQQRVAGMNAAN